jgi:hypothetical protein
MRLLPTPTRLDMNRQVMSLDARLDSTRQPEKDLLTHNFLGGAIFLILFIMVLCGVCGSGKH